MTANEITNKLLIQIPKRFPFIRVWRNNRIEAMVTGKGGKQRRVSAGIDGQGDISGIVGASFVGGFGGRRLEVEVKAGKDRIRATQFAFERMILDHGGIYLVARDVDGFLGELDRVLCGLQGHKD